MHHPARQTTMLALAIATTGTLMACSSPSTSGSTAAGGQSAPETQVATAAGDDPTQAPIGTDGSEASESVKGALCSASDLRVSIKEGDASAGSRHYTISFSNGGSSSCRLDGHPGVSAVDAKNGKQLGKSAARGAPEPESVTLKPGAKAHAALKAVNVGGDGGPLAGRCDVASAAGFAVIPPDTKRAAFVEVSGLKACKSGVNWLTVGSVEK